MKVYGKFTDMFKYVIKRTNVLRNIFFSLTLMTLGASGAWAQTDFSGVYYIANEANHADATVFIVSKDRVRVDFIIDSLEALAQTHTPIIGGILNGV